jgi:hypothetical protein
MTESTPKAERSERANVIPVFYSSPDFSVVSPYSMDAEGYWRRKHGATLYDSNLT